MSLKRNTLWNLIGTGLPLLLAAVTIPYLMRVVGVERVGVLTLVWALIGYFSLFDFGLGRALTQKIAEILHSNEETELHRLTKTGLFFTLFTGVFGGVILLLISGPLAFHWLKLSPDLQSDAFYSLLIAAIGIPIATLTTGFRGVVEAYEDFRIVNILRIALGMANFGLPALSVIFFGKSLAAMVVLLIAARVFSMLAHLWVVNKKMSSKWMKGQLNKNSLKSLMSFGAWMTVSNIVSPLMVTADRFVISSVLGAGLVAYYTIPYEIISRVLLLPTALTTALFPRLATAFVSDPKTAVEIYKKSFKFLIILMLPVCLSLVLGSKLGFYIWLGRDFSENSWVVFCILAIGVFFNSAAMVPYASIQASGDARSTALLHLAEFIFYFPFLYFLLKNFGVIGAAVSWSVRCFFDFIALYILEKKRRSYIKI